MELEKLKAIRESAKMTYQQVADSAGLSKEHYWMIENGKRNLSYQNAVKIAMVFDKEPDDIFLPIELTKAELEATL
ncbi:helix-turn-helix transcriptional regulator [Enterococcus casseliflavus]|uniref:helix-turn-helix transcriptional regulator n=1 Tax=Enterococcus casseliflavus TaxID=37734 RepID=UPI001432812D|nr:helix-turn-helix transcriptional regulator [Enterococcus casseliflavus]NKD29148.1 helix-turn-helix transcriptional regulator [Enterococcus casseliflavus]QOG31627.1 helix-turn-helix transcriptional regulator [Enterococcus casseliflavus]